MLPIDHAYCVYLITVRTAGWRFRRLLCGGGVKYTLKILKVTRKVLSRVLPLSMSLRVIILCWYLLLIVGNGDSQPTRPVSTLPPPGSCQIITDVPLCLHVPWSNASFPNLREHPTQEQANTEVTVFLPLVQRQCSNAIVHFLCAIYTPVCFVNPDGSTLTLQPCRELCMYVRTTCEPPMVASGFPWPSHFECDTFPTNTSQQLEGLCLNIPNVESVKIPPELLPAPTISISATVRASTATQSTGSMLPSVSVRPTNTPNPTGSSQTLTCPSNLELLDHTVVNSSYRFASIPNCAVPCEGIYFSKAERNVVAPAFILICALICIGFTLFTVGTFMIDRQRYHYPERPVIFLALCYLILSLTFVVGAIVKLTDPIASYACSDTSDVNSFVFQYLPNSSPTYHSASCVILFIFIYYFQMAGAIWWVILTLTWFMASTLKWGEEAVERPWALYHLFAWCVPVIQVILILALRLVDGDQLSGICFTGNSHSVALGVFVLFPLLLFLILGILFLVIGFGSLVHIHLQISKDPSKSRRLQRLIIRILVYALLYIVPTFIYICLCIYELAERKQWEESFASCPDTATTPCERHSSPQFAALLMRYLMLFIIGIFSTFWVISWKTLLAWQKFFNSIFFCFRRERQYEPKKKTETAI